MPSIIVKHTVRDYDTWKKVFDADSPNREVISTGGKIFRSMENPNEVTVVMHVKHLDSAKAWIADPKLKATMDSAGVTSAPEISFLQDGGSFTA